MTVELAVAVASLCLWSFLGWMCGRVLVHAVAVDRVGALALLVVMAVLVWL